MDLNKSIFNQYLVWASGFIMVGGLYMDVCTVISTAWSAVSMKGSVRCFFGVGRVQTEQVTLANMKYVKIASLFYMESMTLSSAHTRIHTHTTCTLTHAFILTHTCTYSLSHTHTHLYFHTCIALHTNYTNEVYALLPSLITRKAHLTSRKTIFLIWKLIKKKKKVKWNSWVKSPCLFTFVGNVAQASFEDESWKSWLGTAGYILMMQISPSACNVWMITTSAQEKLCFKLEFFVVQPYWVTLLMKSRNSYWASAAMLGNFTNEEQKQLLS